MLTLDQQRLIAGSFADIAEMAGPIAHLFYGRLFELAPGVRGLFKVSLEEQSKKLLEMLATIVNALDHPEDLRPRLAELGRKHVTYGVKPEHYDFVRKALLWALAQALEGEFDPETKDAWDQLLRAVAAAMLDEQKTIV